MSKQPPTAPTASTIGPCPSVIQVSWTPRHWVNFQCLGVLQIWIGVGQGPTALVVGAGGVFFWTFFLSSIISLFFLPLSGRRPDID